MFGIESLGENAQAVAMVGGVLLEAIVLYVGYGLLASSFGTPFKRVLEGRCAFMEALFRRCPSRENGGIDR